MIIWEGKSELDGSPIVVIMTGLNKVSKNSKTGEMPQVWILRSDIHPINAMREGKDSAICGQCPHRPKVLGEKALSKESRTCYVKAMPLNKIYNTYAKGGYKRTTAEDLSTTLAGMNVRIGAYGDPAAVPIQVWDTLLKFCKSTGYTHQWRTCDKQYNKYCMASCDNLLDVAESIALGYRVFFVQTVNSYDNVVKSYNTTKFAHCPASKEMGKVTTCAACMACSGNRMGRKSHVAIMLH